MTYTKNQAAMEGHMEEILGGGLKRTWWLGMNVRFLLNGLGGRVNGNAINERARTSDKGIYITWQKAEIVGTDKVTLGKI